MKKTLSLTLGLALSSPCFANADDLKLMKQLFDAGQSVNAYDLGLELNSSLAGNPQFDYYFGAAAVDSGDASQGVFALERVLLQQPNNQAARLELARGYFELEEFQRARQEFETVQATNPPEDVQQKITNYLDAIRIKESRYRSTAAGFFRIGVGNDSNANAATDSSTLEGLVGALAGLNGQPITGGSRAQKSAFSGIAAGMNFNLPINSALGFVAGSDIDAVIFNDDNASDFNTTAFNFRAGLKQRVNNDHNLTYQLRHQALVLKDDFYRNSSNLDLLWGWKLDDASQLQSALRFGQNEHAQSNRSDLDTDSTNLGVFYLRQLTGMRFQPVLSVGGLWGQDKAQRDNASSRSRLSKDSIGVAAGIQLNLNQKSSLRTNLSLQQYQYDGPQAAFGKEREDDVLSFGMNYDHLLTRRWKLNAYFTHLDNSSNISFYEYDRNRIGVNFTFETR